MKKLTLKDLNVESFVTTSKTFNGDTVKGGTWFTNTGSNIPSDDCSNLCSDLCSLTCHTSISGTGPTHTITGTIPTVTLKTINLWNC